MKSQELANYFVVISFNVNFIVAAYLTRPPLTASPGTCQITIDTGRSSREYRFQEQLVLSHCVYCDCLPGNIASCFKTDINDTKSTLCLDCNIISSRDVACSYCWHPLWSKDFSIFNISRLGEEIEVSEFDCATCTCSRRGTVYCIYLQQRCYSVSNCVQMFKTLKNETLATDKKCRKCLFDGDKKDRLARWNINYDTLSIPCRCEDSGESVCEISATPTMWLPFKKICRNCTTTSLVKKTFVTKDCSIGGVNLIHNSWQFISKDSTYHCFQCACYMGQLKCLMPDRKVEIYHCVGKDCLEEYESLSTSIRCSLPVHQNKCPPGYLFSWSNQVCNITCIHGSKMFNVIKEKWCTNLGLSDPCEKCPDKKSFLEANKNHVLICHNSSLYIWKDQICDTRKDCPDGKDEENCEKYYCRFGEDKAGIFWNPTEVDTTVSRECSSLVSDSALKGQFTRSCIYSPQNETIWTKANYCDCNRINFPVFDNPGNLTCNKQSLDYMIRSITKLRFHAWQSTNKRLHDIEAKKILNVLYDICKEDTGKGKLIKMNQTFVYIPGRMVFKEQYTKILQEADNLQHSRYQCSTINMPFVKMRQFLIRYFSIIGITNENNHAVLLGAKRNWDRFAQMQHMVQQRENVKELENNHMDAVFFDELENFNRFEEILAAISITFLSLGLIVFQFFSKKTMKIRIHQNLMFVFLLSFLVLKISLWFVPDLQKKSKAGCLVVSLSSYFFTLCTLSWMMVEGINIVILVVFVFQHHKNKLFKLYLLIGYGFPLILTGIFGGVYHDQFQNAEYCTALGGDYIWLLKGPLTLMLVINVVLFLMIIVKIRKSAKESKPWKNTKRTNSSMKTFLVLVPLLGLPFILAPFVEYNKYIAYAFVLMNSLSGLYLFIGHVLIDPVIKDKVLRRTKNFGKTSLSKTNSTTI
ncbi:uncharacterized protein [Clytia hemisphaerica]|uniref:Uncharacterized protein n=1 Tax=Clytia hemisphaerica TaxID=252671 RepID=A0A7M5V2R2_9CNID